MSDRQALHVLLCSSMWIVNILGLLFALPSLCYFNFLIVIFHTGTKTVERTAFFATNESWECKVHVGQCIMNWCFLKCLIGWLIVLLVGDWVLWATWMKRSHLLEIHCPPRKRKKPTSLQKPSFPPLLFDLQMNVNHLNLRVLQPSGTPVAKDFVPVMNYESMNAWK